jgi:hypothetical protein
MTKNCTKSLKTRVEKMAIFCLSTMLIKTQELILPLHDVDEKKESCWK